MFSGSSEKFISFDFYSKKYEALLSKHCVKKNKYQVLFIVLRNGGYIALGLRNLLSFKRNRSSFPNNSQGNHCVEIVFQFLVSIGL